METKSDALRSLRITPGDLERFVVDVLKTTGVSAADALTTARVLVTTDTWGVFTHGSKLLKGYVRRLKGGGLKAAGVPKVRAEGPAWASIDGDSSLGMVTSTAAMDLAIAKSRKCGIGVVGVRNSCHFGGAGYYAVMAAEQGMIGMATANDTPSMTAPGGARPRDGNQSLGLCRAGWAQQAALSGYRHEHRRRRESVRGPCAGQANPKRLARQ